ncbi:MAG: hypothetical protein M1476_05185 [Candidatus Thermoplasmatota archaeon]|nr:hypothetical protein [Candidatus Thermoplasmatota archaeon]
MSTDPDTNIARSMIQSAGLTYGKEPIIMINSPRTQPMAIFTRELGIREGVSAIGVGDLDSRAHTPNESVSFDYFFKTARHTAEFLKLFK